MAAIVADMYDLTPEQCRVWIDLRLLVSAALDQYADGYAVDVEQHMADLAKALAP
jgi:hypothetical protein